MTARTDWADEMEITPRDARATPVASLCGGSRAFCPATLGNLRTRKTESRGLPFLYSLDHEPPLGSDLARARDWVALACGRSSEDHRTGTGTDRDLSTAQSARR